MDPSTWLTPATWKIVVACKVLHFIKNEDQQALDYKTLRVCLVGVKSGWMENKGVKSGEKMVGVCGHLILYPSINFVPDLNDELDIFQPRVIKEFTIV